MSENPRRPAGRNYALPVYLLFFLSGFCGLVYEIIWMRRFAVSFGNTTYAITVVLAAFMAGLAAGSRWVGRLADSPDRKASLFSYYGWMEILVGVYCLSFERLLTAQNGVLLWFYHSFAPSTALSLAFKFLLAALLLLGPTILMGGTLPVLIKALSASLPEVGRTTGRLYFVNCLGAVFGTLAVAFWMIPAFGLSFSTALAAAVNIAVGLVALALRGRVSEPEAAVEEAGSLAGEAPQDSEPAVVVRWALAGIFISGFTAMVYEIAWTRLLSLVLGSSTYSFAVMLAAFISGIALGSLLISRFMPRIERPARIFALCQVAVALSVLAMLPLYSKLPLFFIWCRTLVNFSYPAHAAFEFAVCLLVMLVPTTLIGMGFPLVGRLASSGLSSVAGKVGGVYAVNTLGNILGSLTCALALIPGLGIKHTLELALLLNLAAGLAILAAPGRQKFRRAALVYTLSAAGLLAYFLLAPDWDRKILTGGSFRYHPGVNATPENYLRSARGRELLYYREGISTTVAVEREDTLIMLRVNGKVDASNGLDMHTQLLLAHLPMLLHGNVGQMLVIGAGSGVTCAAALSHPELKSLECAEISPEVIEGSRFFAELNRRYWEDARLKIVLDDGRNYLFRSEEKYDLIASEPSNPWIAGIGNLYTVEFYRNCLERLAPGGLICQWIHLYEMDEKVLKTIIRTFTESFPRTLGFSSMEDNDVLLIGSAGELSFDLEGLAWRMRVGATAADLASIGITSPFILLSNQIFDPQGLQRWAGIGPLNSDNFPLVEYEAPRGFFEANKVKLPDKYRFRSGRTLLASYLNTHQVSADELAGLALYQLRSGSGYNYLVYSALADALEREPEHPLALKLMARLLVERKKYREAEEYISRLPATGITEKELLELQYPLALAFAERRSASFLARPDFSSAVNILRRLSALEPANSFHPYRLGETCAQMGEPRLAAESFETALALRAREDRPLSPEPEEIINRIGGAWLEAEDYERAAYWYTRMAREYPDNDLGPAMLKLIIMERLLSEGGGTDAGSLRRALEK